MDATASAHLQTLRERADYLGHRIEAKRTIGWEYAYDTRERAALLWAIERLSAAEAASA